MSLKELYESGNTTILANATGESVGNKVESAEYLADHTTKKERLIPPVDYTKPENFARFGSAEKYYIDTIKRIYNTYPYDGSLKERIQWENSSSYLDLYTFNNEYPRTNGYVIFSADGWSAAADDADGYGSPTTQEYISVKGGPNTSDRRKGHDIQDDEGDYKDGYANLYDLAKNRESNLKIGGVDGNTVEFWLKKEEFLPTLTEKEVVFDAYTTEFASSSVSYGRLRVEMSGHGVGTNTLSPFYITYMSGTSGFATASIGQNITTASVADDQWHHYAFVFDNTGSNLQAKLYVDGACNHTLIGSATSLAFGDSTVNVNYVSGNIRANIGALAERPSGTIADPNAESDATVGWGKLSGSLDEFRFWKTARNSQQINLQMIQPVGGGANTDKANTALGVYYKFNEGITQTSSVDSTILDYSGRISNGSFVGYNTSARNTGSAMVISGKAPFEFKDPILYSFHPDVKSYYDDKKKVGIEYDYRNNSSIYFSLPTWIIEEEDGKQQTPLKNLTQMIGSYFDTLAINISSLSKLKHKDYLSSSSKPYPFADQLLESAGFTYVPNMFDDATILEQYRDRGDTTLFKQKLYDIKNTIYQNIYNNIVYIHKSKGTEKSFRNLIRCFGVDDEIYKLNIYANNMTYELNDNIRSVARTKNYANFTLTASAGATVYQFTSSANSDSTWFISGSSFTDGTQEGEGLAFSTETEVVFPRRVSQGEVHTLLSGTTYILNNYVPILSSSLFGLHRVSGSADLSDENELTWHGEDFPNFQVYSVKDELYSKRCFFKLTSSNSETTGSVMPTLTSSYFGDVYDDEKWNFVVSVRPFNYPEATTPLGSSGSYVVEFAGVQNVLSDTQRSFAVSGTLTNENGRKFMSANKNVFIGAHRTNYTGSLLKKSDASISSARAWMTYISTGTLKQHATDVNNYGVPNPYRSAYLMQASMTGTYVPQIQTLALNWEFDTVTASDASGQFIVKDFSSGSDSMVSRYNWIGDVVGKQHTGRGDFFPASSSGSINKKYMYSGKKKLPEILYSPDTVNIISSDDDQMFTRDSRPLSYNMFFEKSMYQTISEEMINMFSSIKDFNNLIGDPVNLYRYKYKRMDKLRQLFFERVNNTPDLDKYVEFYKWLDAALEVLLMQLAPASSGLEEGEGVVRNMVESHVLERNKYKHQYPTLEDRTSDPEGKIFGINELLYNWEFGHAPLLDFWNSKSLALNGTANQSLTSIADAASLSFGADGTTGNEPEFSISAWINMTDSSNFYIFQKLEGTAFEYSFKTQAGGDLILLIYDATSGNYIYATEGSTLSTYEGRWIHVCATYDASRAASGITLYINGVDIGASGATIGSYTAMHDTAAGASIGRYSPTSTIAALISEGYIDEVSIYNAELSAAEVSELYNSGYVFDLATFSAAADRVSWWRMGDPPDLVGSSPNFTITDKVGSNSITMSNFQGNSTSGIVGLAARFQHPTTACLWWDDRAERSVASSGVTLVDADRKQILKVKTTVANATAPTLAKSSSAGISVYNGSTYALRNLARPYRLKINEVKGLHGGINFSRNKDIDYFEPISRQFNSTLHGYQINKSSLFSSSCADDSALNDKPTVNFTVIDNEHGSTTDFVGELIAPFNIVSSSVEQTDFTEVNLVNIHHDTYGYDKDAPLQSPFTDKFVGGKPYRHTWNNFDLDSNNENDRAEGWRLQNGATSIKLLEPTYTPAGAFDAELARSVFYRDETAKRPVNIRNIQQATGTTLSGDFTVIGNYVNDYDILHTAGRTINNKYLIEADGLSGSAVNSAVINGLVDYAVPTRDISGSNKFIFVNRFSAPGGPAVSSLGTLDFEAAEYSVYNAMSYRNLTARTALDELYTDHCKQFGFFSDTQNSASYVRAGETYPGTSGSVSADNYEGDPPTASYHKVNRNTRKSIKYSNDGTGDAGTTATASIHDNWFVQHQIPQTDLQYAWITSSIVSDYSGSALYGFEKPDWSNASLASTDLTFCSSSDVGSYVTTGYRWYGAPAWKSGGTYAFIPVDLVGLNSNIYEPVTSSANFLGYPQMSVTVDPSNPDEWTYKGGLTTDLSNTFSGITKLLNGILCHRGSVYGWPSWKQIRGASHPVIRTHRKENRLSWIENDTLIDAGLSLPIKVLYSQIEPVVTGKYKPLIHDLNVKVNFSDDPTIKNTFVVHSYGNELAKFTEKVFDTLDLDLRIPFRNPHKKALMYNTLTYLLRSGELSKEANPIESLNSMMLEQTIYPREKYTYLKTVRQRENYVCGFWRETRQERTDDGTSLALDISNDDISAADGQLDVTAKISLWAMDARNNFSTGSPPTEVADIGTIQSYGILQNDYMQFVCLPGADADCLSSGDFAARLAPQYGKRWVEAMDVPQFVYGGDTKWQAGEQAGVDPFAKNYESYVEDLRRHGKDYGIIPEFRISEHMDFYVNTKYGDFLAKNTAPYTLTGSSQTPGTANFAKIYTHTDFLKHFEVFTTDYGNISSVPGPDGKPEIFMPRELTLRCKAIMKFLPYDGFYPAQRTIDLVKLFWDSYKDNINALGDASNTVEERPYYARPIFQCMFAPGILYNTIKSGLAVDYPIFTSAFTATGSMTGSASPSATGNGIPRIGSDFDHRVPFEALVDPEDPAHLGGQYVVDHEVHPSASLNLTSSLVGTGKDTYKLAMHNFLAENINFFLPNGKLTTIASKTDRDVDFGNVDTTDKIYLMKLVCSHSTLRTTSQMLKAYQGDATLFQSASYRYNPPTVTMYQRTGSGTSSSFATTMEVYGSSFGPPVKTAGVFNWPGPGAVLGGVSDELFTSASFAPYTPPYYGGYSQIVFAFRPEFTGKHTLSDIFSRLTASVQDIDGVTTNGLTGQYARATVDRGPFVAIHSNSTSQQNAMTLTASINYLQGTNLKYLDYKKSGQVDIIKDDPNLPSQWMIQPKFETPILDFGGLSIDLPVSGSGSVARGMWHQYGSIPANSTKGIWLQVQDLDPGEVVVPHLTGSLAKLVGFDTSPKPLGRIASSREVKEAVVAIPFYYRAGTTQKEYFRIERPVIALAEMFLDGQTDEYDSITKWAPELTPSTSIVEMVKKMREYVFPPRLDFLKNREYADGTGGPFAMYIFEFKTTFSQTDLAKIWQNLPPDIGTTMQTQEASIPHHVVPVSESTEFGRSMLQDVPEDIRWMVFKVKKRAKYNYFAETQNSRDDTRFKFDFQSNADTKDATLDYSYNWPYDFFSLVELVNLEAKVKLSAGSNAAPLPVATGNENVEDTGDATDEGLDPVPVVDPNTGQTI